MNFAPGQEPSVHPLVSEELRTDEDVAKESAFQPVALPPSAATTKILVLLAVSAGAGAMLGWTIKRQM